MPDNMRLFYVTWLTDKDVDELHISRDAAPRAVKPSTTTLCARFKKIKPATQEELVVLEVCEECTFVLSQNERK